MGLTMLAAGQAAFKVGDLRANQELIKRLLDEADERQAEILVLPELASSGYTFHDRTEALACAEPIPDGPVSALLREWSRPGRLVACGVCEREGEHLYNSAAVFAGGEHCGTYRKVHLFSKETQVFEPGTAEPPVFTYQGRRVGLMICFDWVFPEMARLLALKGAQVILHPSNLVLPYCQAAMLTRSIENRVFTVTANRFGDERGLAFSGCSQITSPSGERLAQAGRDELGVIAAPVDLALADDKWITPLNHLFNDRQPSVYRKLVEPDG